MMPTGLRLRSGANRIRAAEEASGLIRWLRPDYQNPAGHAAIAQGQQTELDVGPTAPPRKPRDELDEKAIEIEGVTEAEQSYVMSADDSRLRVKYYFAWARTYLKRGGALGNSARGVWPLTDTGSAITGLDGTTAIYEQVDKEERERARLKRLAAKNGSTPSVRPMDPPPEEEGPDDGDWKSTLLGVIGKMSPSGFERLAQRLLREAGFTKVELRGQSGDPVGVASTPDLTCAAVRVRVGCWTCWAASHMWTAQADYPLMR